MKALRSKPHDGTARVDPRRTRRRPQQLMKSGMTVREIDHRALLPAAERLWETEARAQGTTSWLEAIRG